MVGRGMSIRDVISKARVEMSAPVGPGDGKLFGRAVISRGSIALHHKWSGVRHRMAIGARWLSANLAPTALTQLGALRQVAAEHIRYAPDEGKDYWQTPTETLARHAGDCEDIAILRREILVHTGFAENDVRLAGVLTPTGTGHVVTAARIAGVWWVLDVTTDLVIDSRRLDQYRIVYAVDDTFMYTYRNGEDS